MFCKKSRGWRLPIQLGCFLSLAACGGPESERSDQVTVSVDVDAAPASLKPQMVRAGDRIELLSAVPEATIYYTADGSDPRSSSTRSIYSSPIAANSLELRTYVADSRATHAEGEGHARGFVLDPANCVFITAHGATPNDNTDDSSAFRRAVAAARSSGKAVCVPAGTFLHNGALVLSGVNLLGTGERSVLHATNPEEQNIRIEGDGVTVSDLKLTSVASERKAANRHHRLLINGATHFIVERVTVDKSSAAGIMNYGGSHGVIRHNRVMNTMADGIHNTREAFDILIEGNTVEGTGDDLIAMVSYKRHGATLVGPSHDIIIRGNRVGRNTHGRGIAVLGGYNIIIENNEVLAPRFAGIYIASERQYDTHGVHDVTIRQNEVRAAGSSDNGHGALTVYSSTSETVTDIHFISNRVEDSRYRGILLLGRITGTLRFMGNEVRRTGDVGILIASGIEGEAFFTSNTFEETRTGGFSHEAPQWPSRVTLSSNMFNHINSSGRAGVSVISLGTGRMSSLTITNNTHTNPAGYRLRYFIEEHVEADTQIISGNRSPLPSWIHGREVPTP